MVVAYHHFSLMSKIGASKSETGDNLSSAIKMCERSEQHNNFKLSHFTEKVSFNIASEASYVYILSGQKLIKNAEKWIILARFWKPEACGQTVLPDMSILIGQKIGGKCQN